jgi:hypothetical protein
MEEAPADAVGGVFGLGDGDAERCVVSGGGAFNRFSREPWRRHHAQMLRGRVELAT